MRVLWFERDGGRFTSPRHWTRGAAAMTSTHDLATAAGWWTGRDLEWRAELGLAGAALHDEQADRTGDRAALWDAFRDSGAASGDPPPASAGALAADAATRHVASAACDLVVIPIEDALALTESPNLPGTMDQHPNWRRRLPGMAAELLQPQHVSDRLAAVTRARAAS